MDEMAPVRVRIVYGTSQRVESLSATEVRIGPENNVAYRLSGLSRPTKFCMTNIVVLDFTSLWFEQAPGLPLKPDPRMGVLHPTLVPAVKAALKAAGLL